MTTPKKPGLRSDAKRARGRALLAMGDIERFTAMATALRCLEAAPEDIVLLEALQARLVSRIRRCERHIRRYRHIVQALKRLLRTRLSKDWAVATRNALARCYGGMDELEYKRRAWKVFGDGIAHIYLDKYALKQTLLNAGNFDTKEEPGFLDGNDGFDAEWALMQRALAAGVPALLCDLTNTIRHGDVCLLGESTPYLIEVKSSGNQNTRTVRQSRARNAVQEFLHTDRSTDLRGGILMIRNRLPPGEVNHAGTLNGAVCEALDKGWAIVEPEPGLVYVCGHNDAVQDTDGFDDALDRALGDGKGRKSFAMYSLNEVARENQWKYYHPYVLSLVPRHAGLFMGGRLWIAVFVDLAVIEQRFAERNALCTLLPEGPWMLQIETFAEGKRTGASRISQGLLARLAFDFQSLDWFVEAQVGLSMTLDGVAGFDPDAPLNWPENLDV